MSSEVRTRICAKCHRSLFVAPFEHISHQRLYDQYIEYLCLLVEEDRYNVIVSIYDIYNPCRHYFHLLCLCVERAYYINVLGVPRWYKLPCPAIECKAKYGDWKSLNFIPYKLFYSQYEEQNPNWKWISEFQN